MAKASTAVSGANKATGTRKPTKAELAKMAAAAKAVLEKTGGEDAPVTEEQRAADRRADDRIKTDAMAQFVAQQNGEAPPVPNVAEFNAKVAELKALYGVTAEIKAKPAKADKRMQNGITRPGDNTLCGKIWNTADAISAATHGICAIAALKEHADMKAVNDHTIKTQYAKWRAFNGVVGRLPKLHAVHQVQGEYAGLKPIDAPKAETPPAE